MGLLLMDSFADFILAPIGMFSGRPLAVGIALGILGAALAIWLFKLLPAERRFIGELRRAARAIAAVRKSDAAPEQQFAELDRQLEQTSLHNAWTRYRSAVEFIDGRAVSYADPADFFAIAYLPGHGYPKWSSTLGGVFLTIGLFFTFVGLSAALLQMGGDGHGTMAPAQLRTAVEGILAVSSVKFITSIAGILSYIFWSVVARLQSSTQTSAEEALVGQIRGLSTYLAPEMVLRRHLHMSEIQGDTIAKSVGAAVAEALAPLRDELSAMNAQIGQTNRSAAAGAGETVGALWKDGVGQHLDAFGSQMAKALAALEILPEKVQATGSGFSGQIDSTSARLADSALRMSAAFEQGQASMAATLAAFEAKIGSIPASLAAATQNSSQEIGASVRKSLDDVAQASQAGADVMTARLGEIAHSLSHAAAGLREASDSSGEQLRASRSQLAEGAAEGAKIIAESAESAGARLSQTIDAFSLAVLGLTSRLGDVAPAIDAQNQRLIKAGEIVSGASTSLAQAAGSMESAATPLTEASASFQQSMERFTVAADRVGLVSDSGERIAAHLSTFQTHLAGTVATLDALPEKVGATEKSFGVEIDRTAARLADSALRMSAAFEQGQASMASTLAAFETKIGAIPASLAAATQNSSQEIGASIRKTLDDAALTAAQASQAGAETMAARVGEIAVSLSLAAASLKQASESSSEHLLASRSQLVDGAAEGAQIIAKSAEDAGAQLSRTVDAFSLAVLGLTSRLGDVAPAIDAQNQRLIKAGETVSNASNSLARAAGSMESAAAPLTEASGSLQESVDRFRLAADRVQLVSDSGENIAAHLATFHTQLAGTLDTLGALPEKVGATERNFGLEIGRTAEMLAESALRMSAAFDKGQSSMAATLAAFEAKITAIPASLAEASQQSSAEIGAVVRQALDDVALSASEASRVGADAMTARVSEIARSLTSAAATLKEASEATGAQMRDGQNQLIDGVAEGVKSISTTAEETNARLSRTVEAFAVAVLGLSTKLGDVVQGLDAQNDRLERAGQLVSGASKSLVRAAGSVESAAAPLTTASASFQGAMQRFSDAADQVRQISESGQNVADRFERTTEAAQQALGAQAERFRDVEQNVGQMLGNLVQGVQGLGQEISACIATYDNEIAKSIGSLEAALIDVGDIIDTRQAARKS